ncbi:hypothetical protein AKN92_07645 [Thiopseudomonas alkaliphila]|nr:hypothetical protein AKN92_07645 [Thiopseudomonas alkaliphila]
MQTSFELYRALVSINVTEDRAKAVVVALEADMTNHLATKTDIMELKADINELRGALREQGLRLTIQLGLMVSGIMGIGLAAAKLMFTS